MKVYLSGKITGLVYEDALRMFAEAAAEIERCGHEAVNPMAIETDPNLPWAEYMKRDIPHLLGCEAIYLLPNWKDSKGARLEKHIAEELGLLIVTHGFQGRRQVSKPEEWIECQTDGCVVRFIQTDPEAEVDLCPPCEAALYRVAA